MQTRVGVPLLEHQNDRQSTLGEICVCGRLEYLREVDFVIGCHVECGACAHCVKAAALQNSASCCESLCYGVLV